jgi:competence protein ComEA
MKNNQLCLKVFFLVVVVCGCQKTDRFFLESPEVFKVHVDGAIQNPRILSIKPYSTIEDVLSEITLLEDSDLSSLNLQTILHHNDKLTIPFIQTKACININNATIDQLSTLTQIGPVIAQRIIDYRTEHGLFQHIEDITLVKGIGEKTLLKNRDRLCL